MSGYFLVDIVSSLTLQEAEDILDGARAAAREADLLPLTIAVLDSGGNIVALKREDGCGTARSAVALGKAHGALGMGVSSRELRDRLKDRPAFQGAIAVATGGQFIAVPGGVLILNADGKAIGAVGISGDASDRDEYAAIAGIQAAGLRAHPDSPAENWKSAGL